MKCHARCSAAAMQQPAIAMLCTCFCAPALSAAASLLRTQQPCQQRESPPCSMLRSRPALYDNVLTGL